MTPDIEKWPTLLILRCLNKFAWLAFVFGFVALREIKKDNSKKGRGLAIVGLVLGIFVCLGLFGIFMALMDVAK